MKKALLGLLLLVCVVSATADDASLSPLTISPSPIALHPGEKQQFTATFTDQSEVKSCVWLATGTANVIQSDGVNTATLVAGSLKATYVVTASCASANGYTSMAIAVIAVL